MKPSSLLRWAAPWLSWFRTPAWNFNEAARDVSPELDAKRTDPNHIRLLAKKLVARFERFRGSDAVLIGVESYGMGSSPLQGKIVARMYGMDSSRDLRIVFGDPDGSGSSSEQTDPCLVGLDSDAHLLQPVLIQLSSFDECWGLLCCFLTDLDIQSLILQFGEDSCSPLGVHGA